jgi:hypothetical protein
VQFGLAFTRAKYRLACGISWQKIGLWSSIHVGMWLFNMCLSRGTHLNQTMTIPIGKHIVNPDALSAEDRTHEAKNTSTLE